MCVCVCVWVCERERERERVSVCVCVCKLVYMYMQTVFMRQFIMSSSKEYLCYRPLLRMMSPSDLKLAVCVLCV